MRIVLQGAMSPAELAKAVAYIVADTLEKANAEGKVQVMQNPVIEFTLNVEGSEEPVLIVDSETNQMLTVHQGFELGRLVEYVAPDREELVEKFDRMLADAQAELDPEAKA